MGTPDGEIDPAAVWNTECHLALEVGAEATIVLQIAAASGAGMLRTETFDIVVDGRPLPIRRIDGHHGGFVHIVRSPPGNLTIDVRSTVESSAPVEVTENGAFDIEQLTYLWQSRYCPSDRLHAFAAHEFPDMRPGPELVLAVGEWVSERLSYEGGSSGPLDSAVDSLFAGRGVCRDFAHLAITLLRALGVPARLVAVYAPGLTPMDFHAVVEAHIDGGWLILDPTRLAPRSSLLRVSTGRDAADTAFLTVLDGQANLFYTEIVAYTDGDLPSDDHDDLVRLA